jgi:hypothetical protein
MCVGKNSKIIVYGCVIKDVSISECSVMYDFGNNNFFIENSTFESITSVNISGGGCIYSVGSLSVGEPNATFTNVIIKQIRTDSQKGGIIYIFPIGPSRFVFDNVSFSFITLMSSVCVGGVVCVDEHKGSAFILNQLLFSSCEFLFVERAMRGGGLYLAMDVIDKNVINNCTFKSIHGYEYGGAIYVTLASFQIKLTKFINNTLKQSGPEHGSDICHELGSISHLFNSSSVVDSCSTSLRNVFVMKDAAGVIIKDKLLSVGCEEVVCDEIVPTDSRCVYC